jgi:hypothetical protein
VPEITPVSTLAFLPKVKGEIMKMDLLKMLAIFLLGLAISGCAGGMKVGTGQKFFQAVNPEPDKMALVYIFRKDGALSKGFVDFPPYLVTKTTPSSTERFPVIILGDRMYRPMIFEPGEVTFSVKGGGSETLALKSGETRCVEASRSFRGVVVIGVNELPLEKCLQEMNDLELAMTITQVRKLNGATALLQPGFKDLDLEPVAISK